MSEITLTINGKTCAGHQGDSILHIAQANGITIPNLCAHEAVARYGACGMCVVEVAGNPKLVRSCSIDAADGMVIQTNTARTLQARKIAMELLMSDHEGDCVAPCSLSCPAGTDCQGYVKQIALGDDRKAVEIIKQKLPLPASIGRVCPHPCEKDCRRQYAEQAVSIAMLKQFAADNDLASAEPYRAALAAPTGKTVGVIGGGPGGLTAAYFLALAGHSVTIYDAMPKMGGMLRYGIPEYRLPKKVLDSEIAAIAAMGVTMKNDVKIGKDVAFDDLRKAHDATLVAIGAWKSSAIGCVGEELPGVLGGIDFLRAVALGGKPDIGKRVAVVGGGNTAMDACRTAVRLGAEEVYVVYRRTRNEMPAEDVEITEAMEEGVTFKFLTNPAEIIGKDGRAAAVKLQVMELGEPDASGRRSPVPVKDKFEYLDVDTVIGAIGQKVSPIGFEEIALNSRGIIAADEHTYRTSLEGVFAVGDATNKGASIAIEAIGEANRAAGVIDSYLKGAMAAFAEPFVSERAVTDAVKAMIAEKPKAARATMPQRAPEARKHDFAEINLGLAEEVARAEAKRCLECGCHDYHDCKLIECANLQEIHPERVAGEKHEGYVEQALGCIERNQNKCILCNLCVRTCDEVAGKAILGLVGRGFKTVIRPEFHDPAVIADCANCHKCADACPTGALKILK
ncbi:MAG: FAD-dependent oxidoreductase [Oscillospiraceae bacterium]|nr:FAD-dependent oxidoreductase [Oscillospiraceae bacterium]